MVTYFRDENTVSMRGLQIWQILIGMAHNRQTTTYKRLAGMLGYRGSGVLGRQLGHIMYFCRENALPPLTVLVVGKGSGQPGTGLVTVENADLARETVYEYDWYALVPPTAKELAAAWAAGNGAGKTTEPIE